jgi:DNA-binding protein YbaB
MSSFSQLKDMYRIQKEAKRIRKDLAKVHIEAETSGLKVIVTAEQEIVSVHIPDGMEKSAIEVAMKDATNRAMKKAQLVAAERMQSVMKELGMAGGGEGEMPAGPQ